MRLITSASFSPAVAAWLERGRHHVVAGRRVFVVDSGAQSAQAGRAPLLLLHGFPTSSYDFHLVLPELAKKRRVVLFDMPGFGFSDKPEHYSYSLFEQADIVEALIERLGLVAPHVVAHDMGASIACELLARRQRKLLKGDLGSLLLMSAGVYDELVKLTPTQKMLLTPFGSKIGSLGFTAYFRVAIQRLFVRPVALEEVDAMWEQITYLDGQQRLAQVASYIRERARFEERWVGALRTSEYFPIHLLWGSRDPTAVFAVAERLADEIPGVELTRLSKVGHYPQLEAPEETAGAIVAWLDKCEVKPARNRAASSLH